ncbi:MAG: class I SAM-dependent methyltransferase [Deltaproteobacteria bacterium]|nr:class I SAM-dependent methyltransferase [Deltaproteobacteria bacterium]
MKPLKERDIRPSDHGAEQKRRYESDVARLLTHRSEFVHVVCPACGADKPTDHFEKYSLMYKRCLDCSTVYITPRPTPDLLQSYYETSENYAFWNDVIFPASEDARRARIFVPRVAKLDALCKAHGAKQRVLLEVGAGFGTFCEEAMRAGTFERVIAVEPTPSLAETCRKKGIDVRESTIENAVLDEPVDVIASFEVIEHLFDPAAFISSCHKRLPIGGLVVFTCPNIHGFDIDVLGPASPAVDVEHLNYFHPASLSLLLNRLGFDVLETQTPGILDADIVRNRVIDGEFDLKDGFLRRVLIDEWDRLGEAFQRFISDNHLSSNMWICARKR